MNLGASGGGRQGLDGHGTPQAATSEKSSRLDRSGWLLGSLHEQPGGGSQLLLLLQDWFFKLARPLSSINHLL